MLVLFSELLLASLRRNIVNCSGVLHGVHSEAPASYKGKFTSLESTTQSHVRSGSIWGGIFLFIYFFSF